MWSYHPNLVEQDFEQLYDEVKDKCETYMIPMYGAVYESKRKSCFVSDNERAQEYDSINVCG